MLVVSEREEGAVVLHLPIMPIKLALAWSRYQDMNRVPTSLKFDGLATTLPMPVVGVARSVYVDFLIPRHEHTEP